MRPSAESGSSPQPSPYTQATQADQLACDDVSAISVRELRKSYGGHEALRGISFEIAEGEVFSLLGPNGAGKTTTIEILEGYRMRDRGEVEVLGFDPGRAGSPFRERIGIVLQQSQLWPTLTVAETHKLFAGYYSRPRDIDEVIALVGLSEKRDARVKTLSGGQKRRLDLGVALVGDPDLVFLDEPTTGFDPAARRAAWEMIRSLRSLGKTILLTTHYLDEAEQLADRLAVLREGEIIREGTPAELTGGSNETEVRYRKDGREVVVHTTEPTRLLQQLTAEALAEGRELEGLSVRRPTLEDVYLSLTAVLVSIMIVFAIQVASLLALGRLLKSPPWPTHLPSLVLALALGAATFAALGLAITGSIRSLEGSSAVLNVIVLPMAFLTGSFGPTRHYPKVLRAIGDVLPLKYLLDLINGIYLHGQQLWDKPTAVAVLAGWGLFGMAVALRTFR